MDFNLLDVAAYPLAYVVSLFPTAGVPSGFFTSLDLIIGYMSLFDFIIPIGTLFVITTIVVIFEMIFVTIKIFKWGFLAITNVI